MEGGEELSIQELTSYISTYKQQLQQIEAKDPESGASYYYNQSSGICQWGRPVETSTSSQSSSIVTSEDWEEALDETSGQKYYYNKKIQVSQWEPPQVVQQLAPVHVTEQPSMMDRCLNCRGWGIGLVQSWGYCNHCTRYFVAPMRNALCL